MSISLSQRTLSLPPFQLLPVGSRDSRLSRSASTTVSSDSGTPKSPQRNSPSLHPLMPATETSCSRDLENRTGYKTFKLVSCSQLECQNDEEKSLLIVLQQLDMNTSSGSFFEIDKISTHHDDLEILLFRTPAAFETLRFISPYRAFKIEYHNASDPSKTLHLRL
ncbi:unnamed protein product [Vicia faba]|uniref:Uncharacterized protein n=1 Tax=Vicia faba TaxID=3906 RepID=A0AAV1APP3_VICFA|nr:unnamed protein product [Vicia faba]